MRPWRIIRRPPAFSPSAPMSTRILAMFSAQKGNTSQAILNMRRRSGLIRTFNRAEENFRMAKGNRDHAFGRGRPNILLTRSASQLDDAWQEGALRLPQLDALLWGPPLRFSSPARLIENFYGEYESRLAPFILYGSGDFHHLTALWIRRVRLSRWSVASFDNHPDLDDTSAQMVLRRMGQSRLWNCPSTGESASGVAAISKLGGPGPFF